MIVWVQDILLERRVPGFTILENGAKAPSVCCKESVALS